MTINHENEIMKRPWKVNATQNMRLEKKKRSVKNLRPHVDRFGMNHSWWNILWYFLDIFVTRNFTMTWIASTSMKFQVNLPETFPFLDSTITKPPQQLYRRAWSKLNAKSHFSCSFIHILVVSCIQTLNLTFPIYFESEFKAQTWDFSRLTIKIFRAGMNNSRGNRRSGESDGTWSDSTVVQLSRVLSTHVNHHRTRKF